MLKRFFSGTRRAMAQISFIESSELNNKKRVYVQWPGETEDGLNDEIVYEDISTALGIPKNGEFLSRSDQNTVIIPKVSCVVKYKSEGSEHESRIEAKQNAIVPAGTEFTIIGNDVEVLNRKTYAIGKLQVVPKRSQLSPEFSKNVVKLVDVSKVGAVLTQNRENYVDFAVFPGSKSSCPSVGVLENTFNMEWQDIDGKKQVHFVGTGGVLAGGEGNPGIFLINEKKINVNRLLKRIDGSFYLDANNDFLMVTAESNTDGNPNPETLKIAKFPASGVKLPIGFWHSVPIPVPGTGKLFLNEFVVKTNANSVINVAGETGSPLEIEL